MDKQTKTKTTRRGTNINSLKNLVPITQRTPEERRAIAKKAAEASAKKRRDNKTTREILNILLDSNLDDATKKQRYEQIGIDATRKAELLDKMINQSGKNSNMAELVFKLTGDLDERPQTNVTIVQQMSDEQLEQARIQLERGDTDLIDVTPEPPEIMQ